MKKFSKQSAIILSVIMCVVLAIGFVFSFVPIQFSKHRFVSLSGTINISTDLVGGMYGEYDITTEDAKESDVIESISLIRKVYEDDGYKNVNVYAIGNKKVRVELSYPNGDETFLTSYKKLKNIGSGTFSIANKDTTSSSSDDTEDPIVLLGSDGVKEVTVSTYNDQKYLTIKFNKTGEEKFKEICDSVDEDIYLVLGSDAQEISVTNVTSYEEISLSVTDWKNMIELEQKIRLGCTKVDLDGDNAIINTMSATLTAGEASSSPAEKSFYSSTVYIVAFAALLFIAILAIAIFAIKFGLFAVVLTVALFFATYLYLFIAWLVPSFELGLSVIFSLVVGVSLILTYAFNFAQSVKDEYNQGKSLQASLETSFKKSMFSEIITSIVLFVSSLVLIALSFSELTSVAISFAIISAVSLFTNLCVIPFLVKIGISFKGVDRKLFLLEKRNSLADLGEENQAAKENV